MKFDPKGLPVIIGVILIVADFVFQFFPNAGFLASYHPLLYLGLVVALGGYLVGDAL